MCSNFHLFSKYETKWIFFIHLNQRNSNWNTWVRNFEILLVGNKSGYLAATWDKNPLVEGGADCAGSLLRHPNCNWFAKFATLLHFPSFHHLLHFSTWNCNTSSPTRCFSLKRGRGFPFYKFSFVCMLWCCNNVNTLCAWFLKFKHF